MLPFPELCAGITACLSVCEEEWSLNSKMDIRLQYTYLKKTHIKYSTRYDGAYTKTCHCIRLTMFSGRTIDVSTNQGGHTEIRILSSVKMIETLVSHFSVLVMNWP